MIRVRVRYTKLDFLKFISHLDTVDLLRRAIYHIGVDIAYSQGYNPHMLMSFANPLPLGVSSEFEIFDMNLNSLDSLDGLITELNSYLPKEIQIRQARVLKDNIGINEEFKYSLYEFKVYNKDSLEDLNLDLSQQIFQERKKKKGKKKVWINEDISPYIKEHSQFKRTKGDLLELSAVLETSQVKTINPNRFIQAVFNRYEIEMDVDEVFIHKKTMLKA